MTCFRCGVLVAWMNHLVEQPPDCGRCHLNGRLFERGCRRKDCPRERLVDSGWREKRWP